MRNFSDITYRDKKHYVKYAFSIFICTRSPRVLIALTDHHDITEIFLKVALNTINQIKQIKTEQSRTLLLYCETSKVEIKYEYKLLKN
jgi:hypothetical protein